MDNFSMSGVQQQRYSLAALKTQSMAALHIVELQKIA